MTKPGRPKKTPGVARHIKRILQNPPDELPLAELQRITKRGGGVRIENKMQRRSRERQERLRAEKRRKEAVEDMVVIALLPREPGNAQWAGSIVRYLRKAKRLPADVGLMAVTWAAHRLVERGEVRIVRAMSRVGTENNQFELTDHGRRVYSGLARRRPEKASRRESQSVATGYRTDRLLLSALNSGAARGLENLKRETLVSHATAHQALERLGKAGFVRREKAEIDTSIAVPLCARPKFVYRILPAGRRKLAELVAQYGDQDGENRQDAGERTVGSEVGELAEHTENGKGD